MLPSGSILFGSSASRCCRRGWWKRLISCRAIRRRFRGAWRGLCRRKICWKCMGEIRKNGRRNIWVATSNRHRWGAGLTSTESGTQHGNAPVYHLGRHIWHNTLATQALITCHQNIAGRCTLDYTRLFLCVGSMKWHDLCSFELLRVVCIACEHILFLTDSCTMIGMHVYTVMRLGLHNSRRGLLTCMHLL